MWRKRTSNSCNSVKEFYIERSQDPEKLINLSDIIELVSGRTSTSQREALFKGECLWVWGHTCVELWFSSLALLHWLKYWLFQTSVSSPLIWGGCLGKRVRTENFLRGLHELIYKKVCTNCINYYRNSHDYLVLLFLYNHWHCFWLPRENTLPSLWITIYFTTNRCEELFLF